MTSPLLMGRNLQQNQLQGVAVICCDWLGVSDCKVRTGMHEHWNIVQEQNL